MSLKIKIGADELILWIRKNGKATEIPNDGIVGLGRKIYNIVVEDLKGEKIEDDFPSYWAHLVNDENVGKFNLPKTSAQYEIEVTKVGDLYRKLNEL